MNGQKPPLVLMVEDNQDVLLLNKKWLRRTGYETMSAETLAEAWEALEQVSPDIIVLDILLPDGNGLTALPELKARCDAPVLFLSSRQEHKDVLAGLAAGGDGYITKPYKTDELVARVDALWRRECHYREKLHGAMLEKAAIKVIDCGPLHIDVVSGRAMMNGKDVNLKPREFALLLALVQNAGREISGEKLYEIAWRLPANGDTRTIWTHISKLRAKLGLDKTDAIEITAVRGSGYRFNWKKQSEP